MLKAFFASFGAAWVGFIKKTLSLLLAGILGTCPLTGKMYDKFFEKHPENVITPTGFSEYTKGDRALINNASFYVSTDGSDTNCGSFEEPFATLEKARDAVRALDKSGMSSVTVAVKAGEYRTSSLVFSSVDSGTADCPIIYSAYGDGEVVINGGITVKPESFSNVTDSAVLSRLTDEAKNNVVCADLKKYGLTAEDWGKIYAIGSYNTAGRYDGDYTGNLYCELFVNDKRQTLARYPDEGWLYTDKVIKTGYGLESDGSTTHRDDWYDVRNPEPDVYEIDKKLAKRISSWQTLDDVWMFGFWKYDWADASSPVGAFNAEERTLSPRFVSLYGTKKGAPYYFFNVLEELTSPGEWYLDRENGIIYIYPDTDISTAAVDFSVTTKEIIKVNGADYLTFDGFTVKGTRGNAINVVGNNVTVENCLIKNIAGNALLMNGYNNLAFSNEITRTGMGGISITGGDRETLTPGNSKADNNVIHDWSEIYQTYQPAVSLNGVGNICSHNEMFNSPHEAVTYGGNNHIIEYNDIHDVCLLSDDAGAIYSGRRWDWYGNVIRYNAVYNLGSDGHMPDGIYMDDALSGQSIYGNILVNVPKNGIHIGGGRDMVVKNNIVINSQNECIHYDCRARDGVLIKGYWFTHSSSKNGDMWQNLYTSPWQNEIWKSAFPQMQRFSDDFDNTSDPDFVANPAYSEVTDNIVVNASRKLGGICDSANEFSNVTDNYVYGLSDIKNIFVDYEKGDYSLINAPDGFTPIPYSQIGRY